MDTFTAISIIERFCGYEPTEDETIKAWQSIIDSGQVWGLQGKYGRTASDLINARVCQHSTEQHSDYYGNKLPTRKE